MKSLIPSLLLLLTVLPCSAEEQRIYVGTYSRGDSLSDGIYTCTFDDETGMLGKPALAVAADNPSFLAVHPNGKILFACNESNDFRTEETGAVTSFRINAFPADPSPSTTTNKTMIPSPPRK